MATGLMGLEVDLDDVRETVGPTAYKRGAAFASHGNVSGLSWNPDTGVLSATVLGQTGRYRTEAELWSDEDVLLLGDTDCSCPVGLDCKHVAALVIAAARHDWSRSAAGAAPAPAAKRPEALADAWTRPLLEMLAPTLLPVHGTALAIELALEAPLDGTPESGRLLARLMRPGARGGWVNGSLAWASLDDWDLRELKPRPDHLEVVRAFGKIARARQVMGNRYWYGTPDRDKVLDLTDWDEEQLWPLLDRAVRAGITFIHAVGGVGDVPGMRRGELVLDVRAEPDGDVTVIPLLELSEDGRQPYAPNSDSVPVAFIGSEGHGLVLAEAATGEPSRPANGAHRGRVLMGARLRLVRLARGTPAQLRQQVLSGDQLRVPAVGLERFGHEFAPALRHVAPLRSSDGSFSFPQVSAPELVMRVRHADDGPLTVADWGWRYRVGERSVEVDLAPGGWAARDLDAERRALAGLDLGDAEHRDQLARLGLTDDDGRPVADAVTMSGFGAAEFVTDTLPMLSELGGVEVQVHGEAPDYRAVDTSLEIGVGTSTGADADWFDLNVAIRVEGRELALRLVFAALARGEERLLLDDGAHFSLAVPELEALRRLIEEAQLLGEGSAPGSMRVSRYQAGLWHELVGIGVVREQAAGWREAVDGLLGLEELADAAAPPELTAELRHYQREGFRWLTNLYDLRLGGILADDMGLGKTLQVLALICHVRRGGGGPPFLVIAPTSVVPNWAAEAAHFAPGLKVRTMGDTLARAKVGVEELADGVDMVVTTYNLLRLDADAYGARPWAGVILDEAQAVKNHSSKAHAAVRRLPAPFKLAVTGTPMENNLMEIWSLFSIVAPGLFPDPAAFKEHYQLPIERGGAADRLELLRRRLRPLMLRRRKELVASELPIKQEQVLEVALHPRHRKLYDTYLQRERKRILGLLDDFDANRFSILTGITRLRQLSLHAGLVDPENLDVPSAKLDALCESLVEIAAGGHRALIFSQFTGYLGLVRQRLDAAGINYCYLDGKTRRRAEVLKSFKNGTAPAFLISLKAGGSGLNLTEADYCFLLDPWWNPAAEAQAVDRTHRIGQTRQVMVYRMVSAGTIEEKVVALARRKAQLFASVVDDGDLFSARVTAEDVRGLLS